MFFRSRHVISSVTIQSLNILIDQFNAFDPEDINSRKTAAHVSNISKNQLLIVVNVKVFNAIIDTGLDVSDRCSKPTSIISQTYSCEALSDAKLLVIVK